MVEPHPRDCDRSRTSPHGDEPGAYPKRGSDLGRVADRRRAGVVASGLEVIGEPLAGVAVVHHKRRVAVRLEETEEPRTIRVGGKVERLDGRADLEVAVADLGTPGLQDPSE